MPTTVLSFSAAAVTARHKAPFLTDVINAKAGAHIPGGVHRGFRLTTNIAVSTVTVQADPALNDHVAVFLTADGRAVDIRRTGGDFVLDLTAFEGKTVAVVLYADYTIGKDTVAEIRVYELSPTDELTGAGSNLVVLGQVVVPSPGVVIPAANITGDLRVPARDALSAETLPWTPVVDNGSFERSVATTQVEVGDNSLGLELAEGWLAVVTSGSAQASWTVSTAEVRTGTKSILYGQDSGGPAAGTLAIFWQTRNTPVTAGRYVRVSLWVKVVTAAIGGTLVLRLYWQGQDGTVSSSDVVIDISATDVGFRQVLSVVTVPAGVVRLMRSEFRAQDVDTGGTAAVFYLDDVQIQVEPVDNTQAAPEALATEKPLVAETLFMAAREDGVAQALRRGMRLIFDRGVPGTGIQNEGALVLERGTGEGGPFRGSGTLFDPAFQLAGRLWDLGRGLLATPLAMNKARVYARYAAGVTDGYYTLLWESVPETTGTPSPTPVGLRIYIGGLESVSPGVLVMTTNAKWNDDLLQWDKDVVADPASRIRVTRDAVYVDRKAAGLTGWGVSSWDPVSFRVRANASNEDLLAFVDASSGLPAFSLDVTNLLLKVFDEAVSSTAGPLVSGDKTNSIFELFKRAVTTTSGSAFYLDQSAKRLEVFQQATGATSGSGLRLDPLLFRTLKMGAAIDEWGLEIDAGASIVRMLAKALELDGNAAGFFQLFGGELFFSRSLKTLNLRDGRVQFTQVGGTSNPANTVAIVNQAMAKNTVKAWAHITGLQNATPTIAGGFNLTAVTGTANDEFAEFAFASGPLADASFGLQITYNTPDIDGNKIFEDFRSTAGFGLRKSGGVFVGADTVDITVLGVQT